MTQSNEWRLDYTLSSGVCIKDQIGCVAHVFRNKEIAEQIVSDHHAVPKLVEALRAVEAAFFEDSQAAIDSDTGERLDDLEHPWIPGAKAWSVIHQIRGAIALAATTTPPDAGEGQR